MKIGNELIVASESILVSNFTDKIHLEKGLLELFAHN